ncbi:hypothetical protein ASR50_16795 [Streptomyces sp. 4F]|nr:hypothetical protein ASR50_16795 [Streptomyces sp. 4F]
MPAAGTSSRAPSQQPLQSGVQVSGQLCVVGVARGGQRSYHYQATGGQLVDSLAHQMAKPPLHLVAHHCSAHGLAHDETRTRRGSALPRRMRVRCTATKMDDEVLAPGPASSSYRGREVLAPPQPVVGGQHDVMT